MDDVADLADLADVSELTDLVHVPDVTDVIDLADLADVPDVTDVDVNCPLKLSAEGTHMAGCDHSPVCQPETSLFVSSSGVPPNKSDMMASQESKSSDTHIRFFIDPGSLMTSFSTGRNSTTGLPCLAICTRFPSSTSCTSRDRPDFASCMLTVVMFGSCFIFFEGLIAPALLAKLANFFEKRQPGLKRME